MDGGGASPPATLRGVLELLSEADPPLPQLAGALAAAPAARGAILSRLSSRLLALQRATSSKGLEGELSVDLRELRTVAEEGGRGWKGLLWAWSVGLLSQIEEGDAFTGGESIEIRYNARTRQPVCAELASLASVCLSGGEAGTDDAVAHRMAALDALDSGSAQPGAPLLGLLRLTGCCGRGDGEHPKALDWLLVVLGRSHTHDVVAWLLACTVLRGRGWSAGEAQGGRCVAAGSWSTDPGARALDALCQLRGEAVRGVALQAIRGLPAGGWGLVGGVLRLSAECPRVFREVASQELLDGVLTHNFVRDVASGLGMAPQGVGRSIASVLMQRAGLMDMAFLSNVMAMLTPSGIASPGDGGGEGVRKRMRGADGQTLHVQDGIASEAEALTRLACPASVWGHDLCESVRECHDFVLTTSQICLARQRSPSKTGSGQGGPTLSEALQDSASSIIRALSQHTALLAARCCRVREGLVEEAGDRARVADWLELIALQEGEEASCAVVEGFLIGYWDPQGRTLFERVVHTLKSWDPEVTVLAAQRYLDVSSEVGREKQGESVKMIRIMLFGEGGTRDGPVMHPDAFLCVWEGAFKFLCSKPASAKLAGELVGLLSDTVEEVRRDKDAPDTWVLVMRMAVDACEALDACLDLEAECEGGEDLALWARVVEDCKKLLSLLFASEDARHHTKVEVAELLLDKLVKLRDDRGLLSLGVLPTKATRPPEIGAAPTSGPASGKAMTLAEENRIMNGTTTQGAAPPAQNSIAEKIRRERAAAQAQLAGGRQKHKETDFGADVASLLPPRHVHIVDAMRRCFDGACNYITDALLAHLTTHHVVPSIDQYKELLPKRSGHEYDLHIHTKFAETPALLCLLDVISNDHSEFKRCWQVARSLLANCLGYWHSIRDNKIDTKRHAGQIVVTVQVLECMGRAQWLSAPWDLLNEFIPSLTPSEIVRVLLAVWESLIRFPPQAGPYSPSALEGETIRLKPIFIDNIVALAPYYARFFPATFAQLAEDTAEEASG